MNIKHLLLFAMTLLYFTNTYSMDPTSSFTKVSEDRSLYSSGHPEPVEGQRTGKDNIIHTFLSLPLDISLHLIASCKTKSALHTTCKDFHQFIKQHKKEILTHPFLTINQEALDRFVFYYGALDNTAVVKNLLQKGANPTTHYEDNGMTLISYAIKYLNTNMLDMLLEHSVDLSIKNQKNMKAQGLCYASEKGLFDIVQKLLTGNVDINAFNHQGKTPLHVATEQGDVRIMELLLSHGANANEGYRYKRPVNDSYCMTYYTPLHTAIEHGHTIAVQLLIEYGTKIRSEDILLACGKSRTKIFELLINKIDFHVSTYTYDNPTINKLIENHNAKLKQNKKEQKEPEKENDNCVVQ